MKRSAVDLPGIDKFDGIEGVVDSFDWQNWPENFVSHNWIVVFDVDKDRRCDESLSGICLSAHSNCAVLQEASDAPVRVEKYF